MSPRTPLRTVRRYARVLLLLATTSVAAASARAATYYSQGNLDADALASWNSVRTGGGSAPADFVSGDVFVVRDTDTLGLAGSWSISGAGSALQLEAGGVLVVTAPETLSVACVLTNLGTLEVQGMLRFGPGGSFDPASTTPPSYGVGSTLAYANSDSVAAGGEWTGSGVVGAGVPDGVRIEGTGVVTTPAGIRGVAGAVDVVAGVLALDPTAGVLEVGGDWSVAGDSGFAANGRTVRLVGAADQALASGGAHFATLEVNKSGGVVNLLADATVDSSCALVAGNVVTGANALVVGSAGTIARTSGHVVGSLRKTVPAGIASVAFEVGDATAYAPVSVAATGAGFTSAFELTASTAPGDAAGLDSSGLDPARTANRTWTLSAPGYAGGAFDLGLAFDAGDLDAGADPGRFVVRRFESGNWVATGTGTRGASSTQALGVGAFGEFVAGQQAIARYDVAAPSPQVVGDTFTTTVTARDAIGEPVPDDSSTVVTMSSDAFVSYDADGNAAFGDSTKALVGGSLAIDTRGDSAGVVTLLASDANSKSGSLGGFVIEKLFTIDTATLPRGAVGQAYAETLLASGGVPPYGGWTVTAGTLPAGLTLDANTGAIAGTPTTAETQAFTVQVADSVGHLATQSLSITVDAVLAISTTTLPNGYVGAAYAETLLAAGGVPPYGSWTVTVGALPAGLTLDANTGAIAGTPTTAGTQAFTVQVADSAGHLATQSLSMTVDAALAISTTTLPNGYVGTAYAETLLATGGVPPYGSWTVTVGALPAGLTLDASTGAIAGTPTTAETQAFTVQVADSDGHLATQSLSITVDAALAISTTALPNAYVGAAYAETLLATGGVPPYGSWTVTVGALPAGLTLDANTGAIAGTPTTAGTQAFTVQVADSVGHLATQSLSITVDAALAISTTTLPNGYVGTAYAETLLATGGVPPYGSWSVTAGALPAGLTLDSNTGAIAGTPTTAETQAFTVQVADSVGHLATQSLSMTVDAALAISTTTLPNGYVGAAYAETLVAAGGVPPYGSWSVTAGALPAGLTLDSNTGAIAGTPTTAETQAFTVQVADSAGHLATQSLSITVDAALAISTTTLPNGYVGAAYAETLLATGGVPPYSSWAVTVGALPAGLALDASTGAIAGTPTTAETQAFTVQVADSAGHLATQSLSITVDAALAISTTTLPNGYVGTAYAETLLATGGVPPYGSWSVTVGALPAGLTLDANSGAIAGTPTTAETQAFTVQVADSVGHLATQSLSITVDAALAISTTTLPNGYVGAAYAETLLATGGVAPYGSWTVTAGALPAGLTLDSNTGAIAGTPTTAETQAFTVQVADSVGHLATQSLSITVDAALAIATTAVPNAYVGAAYAETLLATGGVPPYGSWSVTVGALPAGLTLDANSGVIAGTPTTAETQAFTVQVADSVGHLATQSLSITVDAALAISTTTLPNGYVGTAYAETLVAAGGVPPYGSWSVTVGALPAGLTLDASTGAIAGTPTTAETQAFTVQVADSVGHLATQSLSITVDAALAISTTTLPNGYVGAAYAETLVAAGGVPPYGSWSVTVGALPAGLTLDSNSGAIAGTPTTAETQAFTVQVADSVGHLATQSLSITVDAALAISTTTLASGYVGTAYAETLLATGGVPPYGSWSVTVGALPAGLTLDASTGSIAGTPTTAETQAFTVQVADSVGHLATQSLSITVDAALAISTTTLANGYVGTAYAETLLATGGVPPYGSWTVTVGALPAGLTLDANTGAIAGTPTTAETQAFTVQVADSVGHLATRSLSITVDAGAAARLAITQSPDTTVAGSLLAPALVAHLVDVGGNAVADSGVSVTVALLDGTGPLLGTLVRATDASGVVTFDDLALEAAGTAKRLVVTSAGLDSAASAFFGVTPAAPASIAFVQQPTPVLVGVAIAPPVTVRVADAYSNGVPGQNVSLALVGTGVLGGTIAAVTDSAGVATFADLAIDAPGAGKVLDATAGPLGPVASDSFDVGCPAIALAPDSLPHGLDGTPYAQAITASGGTAPYAFALTAGALPSGLTLAPNGDLAGTPAGSGSFAFTVTATDSFGCSGSLAFGLVIDATCPAIAVVPDSLPAASVAVPYAQVFTATAGAPPFAFAVTAGALPAGLTLLADGTLSGTPVTAGAYDFTVGVADSNGCTGARAYTLDVLDVPAPIADLAAVRALAGNDSDGTARIVVTFTAPAGADSVEVWRAGFGGYPRYDGAGGSEPAVPSYPPPAPWALTAVTASGQSDEPATRDFWYYVAFSKNAGGGVSTVSNRTSGALDYHLGDVSDGFVLGQGNNQVGNEDVSLLGANYGIAEPELTNRGVLYLDVGPTTDLLLTSRPFTDGRLDFEDFIVFATNFMVVSGPALATTPAGDDAGGAESLVLEAPAGVEPGALVTAHLRFSGSGRVQGFSAKLAWDASVVAPSAVTAGGWLAGQDALVLSPGPGIVDAAQLGVHARGLSGEGEAATVSFRVLRAGDPKFGIETVKARDARNQPVDVATSTELTGEPRVFSTILAAPWPNPARGSATFAFGLAAAGRLDLAIYSVDGRRVRTLASGPREAGEWKLTWDGTGDDARPLAPGLYYARMQAGDRSITRRLVLLR